MSEKEAEDPMEKKINNPVEGRLGIPSLTGTEPHTKFTKRNTNYGVERLGITSGEEPKPDKPASELSKKQKTPAPCTVAAQSIAVSPVSKEMAGQSEPAEAVETKHRYSISSKLSKCKIILGRRKTKRILLLTGIPVIALGLLLWFCLDGGETAPQIASATHATGGTAKSPQNSLETAERPTKHEPGENAARQPEVSPASPTTEKMRQHPRSGEAISTATPTRSAFREVFKFLAKMKSKPETTVPAPTQAALPPKPDKPQDANPVPAAKKASVITLASSQLGLKLGGIMRGPNGKIALINNRSVRVGQTVNNAKVVHIGEFSVEVELKGQRYLVGISSAQTQNHTSNEYKDESSDSDDDETESKTKDEKKEKEQ